MTTSILTRLIVVTAFIAAPATGAPRNDRPEVCALGARIMAEQAHRGVNAFDIQATDSAQLLENAASRAVAPPSKAEWRLLRRRPENLFVRCPELTGRLPEGTRMATPDDLAAVKKLVRYDPLFVGVIHAPLITPDGRRALVYQSVECAGLCGEGSLIAYRRVDRRWVQDRVIFSFVS